MDTPRSAIDFLHGELDAVDIKISRFQGALDACENGVEDKSLHALLDSACMEREIIRHLLDAQAAEGALSLDAQIMERIKAMGERANRLSVHWRRGAPTPEGYWAAEVQRTLLNGLLERFHAWRHNHETLADAPTQYAYPWYMVSGEARENANEANGNGGNHKRGSRSAEMLFADVVSALARTDLAVDHLELIAEPLGNVIVTGYAHSIEEHQRYIDAILGVDGVFEVIEDIKVVARTDCPLCHPETLPARGAQRNGGA